MRGVEAARKGSSVFGRLLIGPSPTGPGVTRVRCAPYPAAMGIESRDGLSIRHRPHSVTFSVSIDGPLQLQLTLDSAPLGYTIIGRATGTSGIAEETLVKTTVANSVISVINPSGEIGPALAISTNAGGTDIQLPRRSSSSRSADAAPDCVAEGAVPTASSARKRRQRADGRIGEFRRPEHVPLRRPKLGVARAMTGQAARPAS